MKINWLVRIKNRFRPLTGMSWFINWIAKALYNQMFPSPREDMLIHDGQEIATRFATSFRPLAGMS